MKELYNNTSQYTNIISKKIIVNAQSKIKENLANEQRLLCHSQFTPTGIFVTKNSKITIELTKNEKDLFSIFIGQWGIYKSLNHGQDLPPKEYVITQQKQSIVSDIEGILYLTNKSETNDYQVLVTVERGIVIPTFIVNKTTNKEFQQMLNANINAPFVEIIGKNVFGTFQMQVARNLWINNDPSRYTINETFTRLDKIYELSNIVSGLNLNYDGAAHKFHNKIQIANPDTGVGYASATDYHITFQQDTKAGEALFTQKSNDDWYLWHEIGHTYQNQNYDWGGLAEVICNINSLWIQRELGFKNRLIIDNVDKEIKNFINLKPYKIFDTQSVWVKLGLFWQLDQAYGKWFYPSLNQNYRLLNSNLLPINNIEKKQLFIQMTSKLVGQNLIPFFEKWGINADKYTQQIVNKYPKLTKEIWNNIFDGHYDKNAIIEYQLPIYQPVQGIKVNGFLKKDIGQTMAIEEIKKHINMRNNLEITNIFSNFYDNPNYIKDSTSFDSFVVSEKNGKLISNKYKISTKLNLENSILLYGTGEELDQYRAIINLNKTNKTFFISGNHTIFHYYYQNQDYIRIIIKNDQENLIYSKNAKGKDTTLIFEDINNINYKNNYVLNIFFLEPWRGIYFDSQINEWVSLQEKSVNFIINNNKLIKI